MTALRRARNLTLPLLLCSASLLTTPAVRAAAPDSAARSEARDRFDRGLTLFNQGDNQGALAEFQRAYQLTGNRVVLYNIARVQAAAGDPVAALQTLEQLIENPGELTSARTSRLDAFRAEQQQRVGSLSIQTPALTDARVEVDGVDAGALKPGQPLLLAAGRHVIGVLSAGHHPVRKTLWIAGREQKTLELTPEPVEGTLGRLHFRVEPIDVAVLLDGEELGRTPNLVELAVTPGRHRLALQRPGYRGIEREIDVPEAGVLSVSEKLAFDPSSRAGHEGMLSVKVSEGAAVVFVDGMVANEVLGGAQLPEGQHRLRVERAGFVPSDRTVTVPRGSSALVTVTLAPTPQYRADYTAAAASRRSWALGIGLGGAVVAGAGAGYLVWNGAQISRAQRDFDRAVDAASGPCGPNAMASCNELTAIATIRRDDLSSKKDRQLFGWVGVGVGAAGLVTGTVLWLTGADPHRYDPRPESDVFGSLELAPWWGKSEAGLRVSHSL